MNDRIEIQAKAQEIIIDKAKAAVDAARERDDAIQLIMAALGVPGDWRIAPDASAFVAPPGQAQGEGDADSTE